MRCTSRRRSHRRSWTSTRRSTQHGRSPGGWFPSAKPAARLPPSTPTGPSTAGHASTRHDAAGLWPDAATGHAPARAASTGHAPARHASTGHASARSASTGHASARIPAPATWSECPGAPVEQNRPAPSERRSILGQRNGQFRRAPCGSILRRRNHDRSQSCGVANGCHGE